ncbi:class I SAM-dependent methyltransferase [Arsenicicoccus dermatophilus]|uniref:class I SAM-dependent methyltransferase n=1 Tax=Arsenicicoccus dermatophilus TaxID=1076331 RepID=UPI001F4CD8D9|nr:class I SAM-dependent methyltransferase [Arsenicicoccus dermatophilus]
MSEQPRGLSEERARLGAALAEGGQRYAELRPTYPPEAVAWGVGDCPGDVADLGAGTGKLTGVLLDLGHRVTAVEPSADMLAQLRTAYPQVVARQSPGEATGLADASCDAVTYGQAWHWVDPGPGSAEAARVLRPGGRLVLIWNVMDLRVPWVAGLDQTMHSIQGGYEPRGESASDVSAAWFAPGECETFGWEQATTARTLAELVTTRSYYLALEPDRRAELAERVRTYVASWCGGVDDREVRLPHVTKVHRFPLLTGATT